MSALQGKETDRFRAASGDCAWLSELQVNFLNKKVLRTYAFVLQQGFADLGTGKAYVVRRWRCGEEEVRCCEERGEKLGRDFCANTEAVSSCGEAS